MPGYLQLRAGAPTAESETFHDVHTEDDTVTDHGANGGVYGGQSCASGPEASLEMVPFTGGNGVVEARHKIQWDAHLANKNMSIQDTELMMKMYERPADERRQRSFRAGRPLNNEKSALSPLFLRIGVTVLQGADKPQVTRLEEQGMAQKPEPDQKDANWRFNTARTLLTDFNVDSDLSFNQVDRTAEIARIARESRLRKKPVNSAERVQHERLLAQGNEDTVTIDSDVVKIVHDLRVVPGGLLWDLQATLIEVDQAALVHLITDFRYLVSKSGPDMTNASTRTVLERMIEDTRRLWYVALFTLLWRREIWQRDCD